MNNFIQLVLHNHYDLGTDYGISDFISEKKIGKENINLFMNGGKISTSVHEITTYNAWEKNGNMLS
jgi:thiamine-phosphate pyrophosphorylase